VSAFLDSYVHFLSLELPRRKGKLLPSAQVARKAKVRPHVVLALLTGNVSRGARLKLEHYGVWHFFELALLPMIIVTATSSGASLALVQERNIGGNSPHPRSTSLAILHAILPAVGHLAHALLRWRPGGGAVMNSEDISRIPDYDLSDVETIIDTLGW